MHMSPKSVMRVASHAILQDFSKCVTLMFMTSGSGSQIPQVRTTPAIPPRLEDSNQRYQPYEGTSRSSEGFWGKAINRNNANALQKALRADVRGLGFRVSSLSGGCR